MAGLAVVLALLMPTDALAQSSTYYDRSGRVVVRSITGSDRATTYFDSGGRVTARSSTNSTGNQTVVYGPDGRRVGSTVTTKPQGR